MSDTQYANDELLLMRIINAFERLEQTRKELEKQDVRSGMKVIYLQRHKNASEHLALHMHCYLQFLAKNGKDVVEMQLKLDKLFPAP